MAGACFAEGAVVNHRACRLSALVRQPVPASLRLDDEGLRTRRGRLPLSELLPLSEVPLDPEDLQQPLEHLRLPTRVGRGYAAPVCAASWSPHALNVLFDWTRPAASPAAPPASRTFQGPALLVGAAPQRPNARTPSATWLWERHRAPPGRPKQRPKQRRVLPAAAKQNRGAERTLRA